MPITEECNSFDIFDPLEEAVLVTLNIAQPLI